MSRLMAAIAVGVIVGVIAAFIYLRWITPPIVGRWKSLSMTGNEESWKIIEFGRDGKAFMQTRIGPPYREEYTNILTYKMDKNHILGISAYETEWSVSDDGTILTLKELGTTDRYRRIEHDQ